MNRHNLPRKRSRILGLAAGIILLFGCGVAWAAQGERKVDFNPRPMPEFSHMEPEAWINTEPLSIADLRGRVILIEVWTTS